MTDTENHDASPDDEAAPAVEAEEPARVTPAEDSGTAPEEREAAPATAAEDGTASEGDEAAPATAAAGGIAPEGDEAAPATAAAEDSGTASEESAAASTTAAAEDGTAPEGDEAVSEASPDEDPSLLGLATGDSPARVRSLIESLLFAADKPLTIRQIKEVLGEQNGHVIRGALADLQAAETEERGVVLHQVAGGFQLRTRPDNAPWVSRLLATRPPRMSRAALETLAIVAYRQPVTRADVEEVRGVDTGGVLKLLLDRNLVRILGKKEEPGRPLLYGTTKEFLAFFNLRDLRDLPTLRDFSELSEEHRLKVETIHGVPSEEEVAADALEAGRPHLTVVTGGAGDPTAADGDAEAGAPESPEERDRRRQRVQAQARADQVLVNEVEAVFHEVDRVRREVNPPKPRMPRSESPEGTPAGVAATAGEDGTEPGPVAAAGEDGMAPATTADEGGAAEAASAAPATTADEGGAAEAPTPEPTEPREHGEETPPT